MMSLDKILISNIKSISNLEVIFDFSNTKILVITGKNGVGKTSFIKAFGIMSDPKIFQKSSAQNSIRENSRIDFDISNYERFSFTYNRKSEALDSRDKLPPQKAIIAELSIPYGKRFEQFSLISKYDGEIRFNIASSNYERADDLIGFLKNIYLDDRFDELMVTKVNKYQFYFLLGDSDYYIREDHLSSGEFFLIQLFRLITSGAELILVDEVDVALDASAQVRLYKSIKSIIENQNTRVILISHSLALMNTVDNGGLYYLEKESEKVILEQRSFGYIKSDLYGFSGKDKYIITEDEVLSGLIKYLIKMFINPFFEYEVVDVGGESQIVNLINKNVDHQIFGLHNNILVIVDGDIFTKVKRRLSKNQLDENLYSSPVLDIEKFVWEQRDKLLTDITLKPFKQAKRDKDTAKTFWKKVIATKQKTADELYQIVHDNNSAQTNKLIKVLKRHLCLQQEIKRLDNLI